MSDSDSDDVVLSAQAIKALHEFQREQLQKLTDELSTTNPNNKFEENWQLSQFWYNENTVDTLANIAVKSVQSGGKIALISCPSLYQKIKETCRPNTEVTLFEYDKRFEIYGKDYFFYDYNNPLNIPEELSRCYDLVIADPPFLSEECLEKTSSTIHFLAKDKIMLNTGEIMEQTANRLLNVTKSDLELKHTRNLGNEIKCFTNFDVKPYLIYNKNAI